MTVTPTERAGRPLRTVRTELPVVRGESLLAPHAALTSTTPTADAASSGLFMDTFYS